MLSVEHVQCSENNHDVSLVVYEQLGPKVIRLFEKPTFNLISRSKDIMLYEPKHV